MYPHTFSHFAHTPSAAYLKLISQRDNSKWEIHHERMTWVTSIARALKWMRSLCPWHEATLLRLQRYRRPAGSSAALQGQLLLGGWMRSCLACVLTLLDIWSLSFSKADTGVYSQASTEDMTDSSEFSSSNFILHPSPYLIGHSFSFMQFTFPQVGVYNILNV